MKKKSIINFFLTTLIIICGLIQLYYRDEYNFYRRFRAILGYFLILPSAIWSFFLTIDVLKFYLKESKKETFVPLYLSIPSIVLLSYFIVSILVMTIMLILGKE